MNPVREYPLYKVMALMVVGHSLERIDSRLETPHERTVAYPLPSQAGLPVSCGWLMNLRPRAVTTFEEIVAERKFLRRSMRLRAHHMSPALSAAFMNRIRSQPRCSPQRET